MHEWRGMRDQLRERRLEVDQVDMAVDSARVAREIREFLGLSDQQQTVIESIFSGSRHQQTRPAQEQWQVGLDETGWTDVQKSIYKETCTPMMNAYGYSNNSNKTDLPAPIELFVPVAAGGIVEMHNVDLKSGSFARTGDHTLQLRPNAPGRGTAEVRYLGLRLNNHHRFTARVLLANPSAPPVQFGFRIEDPVTRTSLASEEKRLTVETSPSPRAVEFSPLKGTYDVIISARMADDAASADGAAAQWLSPTLE